MKRLAGILLVAVFATPALALDLVPAGSVTTRTEETPAGSIRIPEQAWAPGVLASEEEGAVRRRAFRLGNGTLTTLQIMSPLRDALEAAGYDIAFGCADTACGGFDFRFQLDILGEPDMHVDLGDFRYLLARKSTDDAPHIVSIVTSRGPDAGYAHITEVSAVELAQVPTKTLERIPAVSGNPTDLTRELTGRGHAVLGDLEFGSGAAELGPGPYGSLETLAAWLLTQPSARVALVGHTDAIGSADANKALSRRRAEAVADRLVSVYGIARAQVVADGAGFLAPIASNVTEDGRSSNRRVEVVLLALEN